MPQSSALCSFAYGGSTINAVGSVTLSLNRSPFEVSEIGNADAKFIAGYQNATAQVEMFYLEADSQAFETAINTAAAAATTTLTLVTSTDTISGSAFVTGYSVTAAANDVVRASISFQFTGAVTFV
jgi:hypothetical protein